MPDVACVLKYTKSMTVTRKNVSRPVITTNQQNGVDYVFLIILLLFVLIFLGTVISKTRIESKSAGMLPATRISAHRASVIAE